MDMSTPSAISFGQRLKHMRKLRALSQLELAERCGISQRHLAFLELGKSNPSRRMVLDLAETLRLSIDTQNTLLLAAGFAAAYPDTSWSDQRLEYIDQAIEMILEKQEPYPAIVVDRLWNIKRTNRAADRLFAWIFDYEMTIPTDILIGQNLIKLMTTEALQPLMPNAKTLARELLAATQRMVDSSIEILNKLELLEKECGIHNECSSHTLQQPHDWPVIPAILEKNQVKLSLVSTITSFGAPRDLNLQNMLIESFFPTDAVTKAFFLALQNSE